MPPSRLGVIYPHTGMRRFIEVIGPARTRELFFLGVRISAATALSWGLVNWVWTLKSVAARSVDIATEIAAGAPLAQAGNKRVINAVLAERGRISDELGDELLALHRAGFASEDFREGVRAFTEKRSPRWRGH